MKKVMVLVICIVFIIAGNTIVFAQKGKPEVSVEVNPDGSVDLPRRGGACSRGDHSNHFYTEETKFGFEIPYVSRTVKKPKREAAN